MTKLTAIRTAWGTVLLFAPDAVLRRVGERTVDPDSRHVAQILGARELVQALVTSRHYSRPAILGGAAVDATHSATMLALAIWRPAHRRPAAASSLTAAAFAVAGLRISRHEP